MYIEYNYLYMSIIINAMEILKSNIKYLNEFRSRI